MKTVTVEGVVCVEQETNVSKGFFESPMMTLFFAMLILLIFFLIVDNLDFLNDIAQEIAILLSGKKI